METSAPASGLLASLRNFTDGLIGSAQDRLQLLSVELQEEKNRLVQILVWLAAIVALGFLTVVFASLVLVFVYWETARVAVAVGLTAGYGLGLFVTIFYFRRYLSRQRKPFAATLNELQQDRECIRAEN